MASILYNGSQIDLTPALFSTDNSSRPVYKQMFNQRQQNRTDDGDEVYGLPEDGSIPIVKRNIVEEPTTRKSRSRRSINGQAVSFYIEYLIVIDSTVYASFQSLYANLSTDLMYEYIKIFYSHLVNGVIIIFTCNGAGFIYLFHFKNKLL
jgi:hypothetical protein